MNITIKGWLKKQPVQRAGKSGLKAKLSGAKRRYFLLFEGQGLSNLVYFTNQKCSKEKGRLVITSQSTVQARLANHSFELVDREGNVFVAQADSDVEAENWVERLQDTIAAHKAAENPSAAPFASHKAAGSAGSQPAGQGHRAGASDSSAASTSAKGPPAGSDEWVAQLRQLEQGHQEQLREIRRATSDVDFHDRDYHDPNASDDSADDEFMDPQTIENLALKLKLEMELDQARRKLAQYGHDPHPLQGVAKSEDSSAFEEKLRKAAEPQSQDAHSLPEPQPEATVQVAAVPDASEATATGPPPPSSSSAVGATKEWSPDMNNFDGSASANADDPNATWLNTLSQLEQLRKGGALAKKAAAANAPKPRQKNNGTSSKATTSNHSPTKSMDTTTASFRDEPHQLRLENSRLKDELEKLRRTHAEDMSAARIEAQQLKSEITSLRTQLEEARRSGPSAGVEEPNTKDCNCTVA